MGLMVQVAWWTWAAWMMGPSAWMGRFPRRAAEGADGDGWRAVDLFLVLMGWGVHFFFSFLETLVVVVTRGEVRISPF